MPGPLSMPLQHKEKFRSLDTAEKRALAQEKGTLHTGKTAKNAHKQPAGFDQLLESASPSLKKRLNDWKNSKQCQDAPGAFHRPGSNKK